MRALEGLLLCMPFGFDFGAILRRPGTNFGGIFGPGSFEIWTFATEFLREARRRPFCKRQVA